MVVLLLFINLLNTVFCVIERHGGAALSFTRQACPECLRCPIKTILCFVSRPFEILATILFTRLALRSVYRHTATSFSQNFATFRAPFGVPLPCVPCVTDEPAMIEVLLSFAPLLTLATSTLDPLCLHYVCSMFRGTLGSPRYSVSKLRAKWNSDHKVME